ncbi:TniB family NTP-binding protein [Herbaspirillum lusitanum]|uniref:TniB family NTP-binding protein n=1 Tax=Herbaspirillum lusitanum TaxID=213312 RepID=UPI0003767420|nr:TniB family NTP-binding protein [Herbaspirillum lusitanum]
MTLPFYDAIKQFQDAYLMFPAFQAAFEQMESNLKLYRATGMAQSLLVFGESGTGKTSLGELFAGRYPKEVLIERDLIPVLHVSIPAAATIAGTVESVLARLGDPEPERGTVSVKTARAVKIAKGCGVEMLLFDEAQHIQDRGHSKSQYFVGDWLKTFMDALKLPVTLMGLPRTQSLLQVNEQLRRRFTHRLSLSTTGDGRETTNDDSLALFTSLASVLPLPLDPRPYTWQELGVRLHFSTDGRIAYVKQLLISAYVKAVDQGCARISISELTDAFTTVIWPSGVGSLNPFHKDFVFRSLDRSGEPFQIGDIHAVVQSRRMK